MRIDTRSDKIFVPPVTALRSPPDSRITGALSPVMTDSSTVAMPSITSPSPGMMSPVSHSTTSPQRSSEAATDSILPFAAQRLAIVSVLVLRSVSACALPRASAMASAKFANSTVNHSQMAIWKLESDAPAAAERVARQKNGGDQRAHFHHEHHRIPDQRRRVQFDHAIPQGAAQDLRIEQRARTRQLLGQQFGGIEVGRRGFNRRHIRTASLDASGSARRWGPGKARGKMSAR